MSRIYQYPVVTEIGSDDYLALGSVNGSRSILASNLAPVIGNKTITERGTYKASDDNMDGYGQVTVDIPYTDIHVVSGDIVTFEGEDLPLKSLKVAVTPYQDLHGYDAPWAGGAGKNKIPPLGNASNNGITMTTDINGNTIFNGTVASGAVFEAYVDLPSALTGNYVLSINNSQTIDGTYQNTFIALYNGSTRIHATLMNNQDAKIIVTNGTITRFLIRFQSGVTVTNFKISVQLEEGSTATSYLPYSNICPIIGWDEAVVTRCGKNLWGGEKLADDIVAKVPQASKDTTNKTVTYHASQITQKVLFDNFKENTQYTIYLSTSSQYTNIGISYADGSSETIDPNTYKTTLANKTVTQVVGRWASGSTVLKYEECGIFEGVVTASDFEPYNGATYTIDLNGTRYGGTLDVVNGIDTDRLGYVDLGSLNWYKASASNKQYFYAIITTLKKVTTRTLSMMCSNYPCISDGTAFADLPDGCCYNMEAQDEGSQRICIIDSRYDDVTTFKQAMSGVQLVYELATPITVQLAPTQVKSLEGTNNIFANCGAVDVEYQTVWVRPSN